MSFLGGVLVIFITLLAVTLATPISPHEAAKVSRREALLSQGRYAMGVSAVGTKAFFAGGIAQAANSGIAVPTVDIYDSLTDTWTRGSDLPVASAQSACAAVVAGGIALARGGSQGNVSDVVDIFSPKGRTTARLPQPRVSHAAAVLGQKVFFAGGNTVWPNKGQTNTVDVFDTATNTWSRATLSFPRQDLAAASAGSKILFAGGFNGSSTFGFSSRIDIYDMSTNTWTTSELSQARWGLAAAAWGNKVFFAGGFAAQGLTAQVDIFDVDTNLWSSAQLSQRCGGMSGVALNGKVIFAGGTNITTITAVVNIFDVGLF